ncbi:MAG TPA: TetR/AcrR family transcriptional regulator [Syntrophales bacterium]|nr:TetR/AcrR family transcriptional regulator [Syntrophales bacterium]HPQ43089.1 TetR/AcrR family transcriptional regulator [Syntrophales bacterium]
MGSRERRQREKEQRRAQILDTARTLLFKKGIDATSMNQIAKNAELSVGTLYLYFKNKESLFAALQEEGLTLLYDTIREESTKGLTPRERLEKVALAYFDFSEQYRKYFDIINYFLTSPEIVFPPSLKVKVDGHVNRIFSVVGDILKEGIARDADDREIRRLVVVFCSSLHGILQFKKLQNTVLVGEDFRKLYQYHFDCIVTSVLHG